MQIKLLKRATIAIDSLDQRDQKKVAKALEWMSVENPFKYKNPKIRKLPVPNLYSFEVSRDLRMLFGRSEDGSAIEIFDIADHDSLSHLVRQGVS